MSAEQTVNFARYEVTNACVLRVGQAQNKQMASIYFQGH